MLQGTVPRQSSEGVLSPLVYDQNTFYVLSEAWTALTQSPRDWAAAAQEKKYAARNRTELFSCDFNQKLVW